MNHIAKVVQVLVLAVLFVLVRSISAQTAPASPSACISGSILTNTTWSVAGSPYSVCVAGFTVPTGVTLTIDPGVTVKFADGTGDKLYVQGALIAKGTAALPITMVSVQSTLGALWGGISATGVVGTPAVVTLDNVILNLGGGSGSFGAEVYTDRTVVTITSQLSLPASQYFDGQGE